MEIQFKEVSSAWEADLEVTGDFNIHLERNKKSPVKIMQKTAGNKFADTVIFDDAYTEFDCDFTGFVYPKTIKVVSFSPVNVGIITQNA